MNKIEEKINKVMESKSLVKILAAAGAVVVIFLVFCAGMSVGFHQASFGRAWGDRYYENFGVPVHHGFGLMDIDNSPNAHGAIGKIIKIELPSIIVQDKDGTEKVILIKDDTKIEKVRDNIPAASLAIDDFVIVIGSPNETGQIEAKFIRVVPNSTF